MQGEERRNREWPKTKGKNVGKQNQAAACVFKLVAWNRWGKRKSGTRIHEQGEGER